jgi:hypothetical protein
MCAIRTSRRRPEQRGRSLPQTTSCDRPRAASTDCSIRDGAVTSPLLAGLLLQALSDCVRSFAIYGEAPRSTETGSTSPTSISSVAPSSSYARDLLYEPDEDLERDAEFPPMRGKRARGGLGTPVAGRATAQWRIPR